jgi:transmembrane sensor
MNCDYSESDWTIAEQAAAWRVTLGGQDGRRVPEFWSWVTQSPVHVREALVMGLLNRELQEVDPDMSVSLADPADRGTRAAGQEVRPDVSAHRGWMVPLLLAASVVVLLLGSLFFLKVSDDPGVFSHTYVTDVGEERMVTLKDGSSFVLDAQSSLRVEISARERSFYLEGQAVFNVTHDPLRPFRVRTAATTVEALGTEFNVRTGDLTRVAVFNGAVRLYSQGDAKSGSAESTASFTAGIAKLTAGEGVIISADGGIAERRKVDRASVMAWEQRQLVFSRAPLDEIVREFNRYNQRGRMRVEGSAASLRFGGVFDATDPGPLLLILSRNPKILLEHQGEELVIRDRP